MVAAVGPTNLIPAQLLGVLSGRAVVHKLPGDGLIWEPGEGIAVEAQGLVGGGEVLNQSFLNIAALGYITVP